MDGFPFGNLLLNLAILAWAVAQTLKLLINLAVNGKGTWRVLFSSGGMPSSHSATVCALASAAVCLHGWDSPYFAISAVVAVVVMYDACNVRQETGKQAQILNYMMDNWGQIRPEELFEKSLKELIGHTPFQVLMGGVLGVAVGWAGAAIWG